MNRAEGAGVLRAQAPAALLCLGVAAHLLFLLSLRFGWLNPLFNDTCHRFGPGGDFFSLYAAGVKARAQESVYTVGGHVETVPYAYAFRYAPLVAYTVGAALSFLPAIGAYAAWLIACELALLRNVRLTLALAPDKKTGYVAAALWLLFTPYYLELFVGQFTFITASLVFWAYLGWREPPGRARRRGDWLWIGAVWLKMMPLLFLPVALLRGRWQAPPAPNSGGAGTHPAASGGPPAPAHRASAAGTMGGRGVLDLASDAALALISSPLRCTRCRGPASRGGEGGEERAGRGFPLAPPGLGAGGPSWVYHPR